MILKLNEENYYGTKSFTSLLRICTLFLYCWYTAYFDVLNKDFNMDDEYRNLQFTGKYETMDILNLNIVFSKDEYKKINNGFIAEEMEDKWNIYFCNDKLYFNRSWTGSLTYIAHFKKHADGYQIIQIDYNRNKEEYSEKDSNYDLQIMLFLIFAILLDKDDDFPLKENSKYPALEIWANVGRKGFDN